METTCPSCGAVARERDRFCGRCGTALSDGAIRPVLGSHFCTHCGGPLRADERFCGRCGAEVSLGAGPVAAETEDQEDPLAEWNLDTPRPFHSSGADSAPTETISVRTPQPTDTAVLPQAPEPYSEPAQPDRPARPASPRPTEPSRGFPLGATVALLGAVAVILSSILEWRGPFEGSLPRDIPFRLLIDPDGPGSGLSLGIVLLAAGTLGALVALVTMAAPFLRFARRLIGLATLAAPALFGFRTLTPLLADGEPDLIWSSLGVGVYFAAAGALVQMVAGKWFRR